MKTVDEKKIEQQIDMTNHKGTWCIYRKHKFCQEGICSDCQIKRDAETQEGCNA